jgi:molybdopterin-binding protein
MADGPAHAVIRGEDVALSRDTPVRGSSRNVLDGTVVELLVSGVVARVTLDIHGVPLVAVITAAALADLAIEVGATVRASVKAMSVHLC